jgi:hypothetical protein
MPDPARLDLTADRRTVFSESVVFLGDNYTGGDFDLWIKLYPDAPGAPLVQLDPVTDPTAEGIKLVYGGADTVANHVSAGRLSGNGQGSIYSMTNPATGLAYQSTDTLTLSQLTITIDVDEDLDLVVADDRFPYPEERGDTIDLAYDFLAKTSGGRWEKRLYGTFSVRPAVVRA